MRRQRLLLILTLSMCAFGQYGSPACAGVLVNFDSLNSRPSGVDGPALDNYLASYGLSITNVTPGSRIVVLDDRDIYAGIQPVIAPSPHNVLTQQGLNIPNSYLVQSVTLLNSFSFTRPMIRAGDTGIALPEWSAHALDSNGVELSSVGEPFRGAFVDQPAITYMLTGPGIASIRFDSYSYNFAAFSAMMYDNFVLDPGPMASVPEPGTLALLGVGGLGLVGYRRWRKRG